MPAKSKRAKSAGKTRCQACLSLSINGILINDIPLACGMLGGISRADNCDWRIFESIRKRQPMGCLFLILYSSSSNKHCASLLNM